MNYLQLINDYMVETSAGDSVGSVASSTIEGAKAAQWIKDAWVEIQRARFWKFRWAEATFNTTADIEYITRVSFGRTYGDVFDQDSWEITDSNNGNILVPMTKVDYQVLQRKQRNQPQSGLPVQWAVKPDDSILLYPKPDKGYVISYEYYKAAVILAADADTPLLPAEYHKAIVWKAVENYARDEGQEWQGLYQAAIRNYNAIYSEMLNTQLPDVSKKRSF